MTSYLKITELPEIASANIFANVILPVVRTDILETDKGTLGNIANVVLNGTGSAFARAANANVAFTVANAAQANITSVGTLTSLEVTGNVTAGNVYANSGTIGATTLTISGNGSFGNIAGIFANTTSNIRIPAAAGNVNISASGNANILVVTGTGANITGTIGVSGNANVGNIGSAAVVATANISGANIITAAAAVVKTTSTTVASLPSAATVGAGARSFVTDGNLTATGNFGAIIGGSQSNAVPVYSDGTNWRIG